VLQHTHHMAAMEKGQASPGPDGGDDEPKTEQKVKDALSSWFGVEGEGEPEPEDAILREGRLKSNGKAKKKTEETKLLCKNGTYWVILVPGALHFYKDQFAKEPFASLPLKRTKLSYAMGDAYERSKGKNQFQIDSSECSLTFTARDDDDHTLWVREIEANSKAEPTPAPARNIAEKKGKMFSAKKHISEKAAMSKAGAKLLRSHAPDEAVQALDLAKALFERLAPSEKKGREHYKNLLRIVFKTLLLYREGHVKGSELEAIRIPTLILWSNFLDTVSGKRDVEPEQWQAEVAGVQRCSVKMLRPHLTPNSIQNRLKPICELLMMSSSLRLLFEDSDDKLVQVRQELVPLLQTLWDTKVSAAQKAEVEKVKLASGRVLLESKG